MSLLGGLIPNPNSPDVALAAGLLGGRGNWGANLAQGLLGGQQASQANRQFALVQQNAERANRANDLQQIGGLYQNLQTQDMIQAIRDKQAGVPHVRNPALSVLEQKMSELAGVPLLTGSAPSAQPAQGAQPSPFKYGANPSLQAPAVPPAVGQNFSGANPSYQPSPLLPASPQAQPAPMPSVGAPAQAAPMPSVSAPQGAPPQDPFAATRDDADILALLARKPELMAENRYKLSLPQLSRGVSFNPSNGLPIFGMVDNVPVKFDAQGNPTVVPNQIGQAIADRAGQTTAATEGAKAPYTFHNVTTASGATVPMSTSQLMGNQGFLQPRPSPSSPAVPPQVQAAADSGKPFEATQAPGGQVQFNPNPGKPNPQQDIWATIPKAPQPTGLGQSTEDKKMSELRVEKIGKLSDQYSAEGDVANQRKALNNQALAAVDNADTGFFSGAVSTYRNILGSLGVKGAQEKAATDQELGKNLINTALTKGKQLFGARFTQSEVGIMLSQASPSPQMQKLAIKFLLQSDNLTQQYNVQRGNDFGEYVARGGDPLRFTNWYNSVHPLTKDLESLVPIGQQQAAEGQQSPAPSGAVRRYNPTTGRIE